MDNEYLERLFGGVKVRSLLIKLVHDAVGPAVRCCVYRFSAGRLVAIERAPGPPPTAAKPQKPAKPAKKPAAS